MAVKYVFVTGGVVSGLGKGITAASLGRLLKARGYTVTMQKFDPYINIDPGTMNPVQHGEVFVTDDGAETDLDLGHYERFIDESLTKNSNVTTGKIYWSVLQKERRGDFGGGTVQVIPHITNEIKSRFYRNPAAEDTEIAIIEVGGTVGDIESQPFLESIRQFQHEKGRENVILIHVTLIPYLRASQEMKTKPTQASVKELQSMGIQPDIIVCRSEYPLTSDMKDKISLFCNLPASHVLQNLDVEYLYEAPLAMEKERLAQVVCECLHLDCPEPDLKDWTEMVDKLKHPTQEVTVALVGKYIQLHDAYISVVEALKHGGIYSHTTVNIKWVDSEKVTAENADEIFSDVSGILVPGGFGHRGIDGKIEAIRYARIHGVPFLGLCLGMQLAIVEFARDVVGFHDAHHGNDLKPVLQQREGLHHFIQYVHPAAVLLLHLYRALQGIADHKTSLLPCHIEISGQGVAVVNTQSAGILVHGLRPAVAHIGAAVLAQNHQQCLGQLPGRHIVLGTELAVIPAQNPLFSTVFNIVAGPGVGRIGVAAGGVLRHGVFPQERNNFCNLCTGDRVIGTKAVVGIAADHAQGCENGYLGLIIHLIPVGKVKGGRLHRRSACGQSESQCQCEKTTS